MLPASPYSETNLDASLMSKQLWFARLSAVWRYKWILLLALIAGMAWGIQSVFSATPQYRASLTLLLEPEGYYAESTTGMSNFYSWKSVATQHALIQSRSLAERVVDDLNLVDRRPLLITPERKFQGSLMNWAVALREHITGAAGDLLKSAEAHSQMPAGNASDQQNDGRRDALDRPPAWRQRNWPRPTSTCLAWCCRRQIHAGPITIPTTATSTSPIIRWTRPARSVERQRLTAHSPPGFLNGFSEEPYRLNSIPWASGSSSEKFTVLVLRRM